MIKNLIQIQNELKAPKSNYNSFGKYSYRSAEDILTAVKPILAKYNCQLTISDDVIAVGNRIYIRATATITDVDGNSQTVSALAREAEEKKGMDASQITGTASSYARKYCLNGLFLIDDCKDADTDAYHFQTSDSEKTFDRVFLSQHGNDRIGKREAERLISACESTGGRMSIEKALTACKRSDVSEITFIQYTALMSQLGAVA